MWKSTEPVRSYLYTLLAPIVALLVYTGVVTDDGAPLWTALATAVLGVVGTETARSKVRSKASLKPDAQTSTWD